MMKGRKDFLRETQLTKRKVRRIKYEKTKSKSRKFLKDEILPPFKETRLEKPLSTLETVMM